MRATGLRVCLAIAVAALTACGSRSPIDVQGAPRDSGNDLTACTPGETRACAGADGCRGTLLCNSDGTGFGSCACEVSCDGGVSSVYLVSTDGSLYRFDPSTGSTTHLAAIGCGIHPESMAVDRRGVAWVEDFGNQHLYTVSLRDGSCSLTPFVFPPDFDHFGMSFVADYPGALTERLYVAGDAGLRIIDTTTFVLTTVGPWTSFPNGIAELAGTADA
jgi:streptogramin lyase